RDEKQTKRKGNCEGSESNSHFRLPIADCRLNTGYDGACLQLLETQAARSHPPPQVGSPLGVPSPFHLIYRRRIVLVPDLVDLFALTFAHEKPVRVIHHHTVHLTDILVSVNHPSRNEH